MSEPVKPVRRERVKPQVSAPVTRVSEPVQAPARLHSVNRPDRVKALRSEGLTWAAVAAQVGCSVSTAKREAAA